MTANRVVTSFVESCTHCGSCRSVCPFLEQYGDPAEIIGRADDTVFLCTNCGACTQVCPSALNPADALYATKSMRLKSAVLSASVQRAHRSALAFAQRGHSLPFCAWKPARTVFWPGCGLAGTNPTLVGVVVRHLAKHLHEQVGIVLDCCFDPLWQLGDVEAVDDAISCIQNRLRRSGVKTIITGCINCTKVLEPRLPTLSVRHVLTVLPASLFRDTPSGAAFHHPCPSIRIGGLREHALAIAVRPADGAEAPQCCGCGGGLRGLEPELAGRFAGKIAKQAGSAVVTYCMGCKNTFIKEGRSSTHLLELLEGASAVTTPVPGMKKWINRLILRLRLAFASITAR